MQKKQGNSFLNFPVWNKKNVSEFNILLWPVKKQNDGVNQFNPNSAIDIAESLTDIYPMLRKKALDKLERG